MVDFQQWIGPAALAIAVYGAYQQRKQTRIMTAQAQATGAGANLWWKSPTVGALIVLVIAAWIPRFLPPVETEVAISAYGITPPLTFHSELDTKPVVSRKITDRLLYIVRLGYDNIDRMSDTAIEKSILYTIDGSSFRMSIVVQLNPMRLRVNPAHPAVNVEHNVVIIPSTFSTGQINSLSDVEQLGGRILATRRQVVPFSALGIQVTPAAN